MKPQLVRLADVFFIGPLMMYGGYELSKKHKNLGNTLVGLGIATILYNGYNYLEKRKQLGQ